MGLTQAAETEMGMIQPHWKVPDGFSVTSRGSDIAQQALSHGDPARALVYIMGYQCALLENLVEKLTSLDGTACVALNEMGKMLQVTHEEVKATRTTVTDAMNRRRKWGDEASS